MHAPCSNFANRTCAGMRGVTTIFDVKGLAMEEERAIIKLNLRHYRELLRLPMDDAKRARVKALVAEAEAHLAGRPLDPSHAQC